MWKREIDGLRLTFHLAGINNQNFLMRDEETGTYWQQINGRAVSGPLAGRTLELVACDELSFGAWRSEQPRGKVLADVPGYAREYAPKDWDVRMARAPTVLSYAEPGLGPRALMLGIRAFGASRAYLYERVLKEKLVLDRVGSEPVLLVVGEDGRSVRAFRRKAAREFYRTQEGALLMDDGDSAWNFQGCAVSGPAKGQCLERVEVIKDYWFDWRHYNPATTVYGRGAGQP